MPPPRPFISSFWASSSLRRASSWAALTGLRGFRASSATKSDVSIVMREQRVLAGDFELHQAAAGAAFDLHGFELFLRLVDLGLHGLRLAHDLRDVFHRKFLTVRFLFARRRKRSLLLRHRHDVGAAGDFPLAVRAQRRSSAPGKCFSASATNGWRFSSSRRAALRACVARRGFPPARPGRRRRGYSIRTACVLPATPSAGAPDRAAGLACATNTISPCGEKRVTFRRSSASSNSMSRSSATSAMMSSKRLKRRVRLVAFAGLGPPARPD